MPKDVILTPEGLDKLQSELLELQTTRRREVADRIKEAREFGDISENSEYDDAKNEQAMLEQRIANIEERCARRRSSTASDLSTDIVGVGSIVNVKDDKGQSLKFTIVGSAEAQPPERSPTSRPSARR
jgi:transcription elongation factor GreA